METFTIGELAYMVFHEDEQHTRKMLNEVGASPRLNEYTKNPRERVTRDLVIALAAKYENASTGRTLLAMLKGSFWPKDDPEPIEEESVEPKWLKEDREPWEYLWYDEW